MIAKAKYIPLLVIDIASILSGLGFVILGIAVKSYK